MERTFTLTITGTEHGEWQGRLQNGYGSEESFASLWSYSNKLITNWREKPHEKTTVEHFAVRVHGADPAAAACGGNRPCEACGEGTSVSPYQISSSSNLLFLADAVNRGEEAYVSAYYKQTADIDLSGVSNWTPIGKYDPYNHQSDRPFSGTFDGGGKTIRNLTDNAPGTNGQGLFGYARGASIRNLTLADCAVSGKGFVGGIVGSAPQSTISDCTVSGTVSGSSSVGGIAGSIPGAEGKEGSIVNCINRASVSGTGSYIAGVAGQVVNFAKIEKLPQRGNGHR